MIPNYSGCDKCPLRDCPPVRGFGNLKEIVVVGEAPGANEVIRKQPFVGTSGKLLRETLTICGVNPDDVYYTNACLCRPPENKTPTPLAVQCCNKRLRDELYHLAPSKILAVGGTALAALISPGMSAPITKFRGQGMRIPLGIHTIIGDEDLVDVEQTAFLVSTYHPAAVNRDNDLFRDFASDILKLASRSSSIPKPEITTIVPSSRELLESWLDAFRDASVISCDLETTGFSPIRNQIISIGFGALIDETDESFALIIPIDLANDNRELIVDFIRTFDGVLAFHNIKFDLQFLQVWSSDYRLEPRHPADTMLMQYAQDERGSGVPTSSGATGGGRGYRVHGLKDQARIRYDIPDYHFDFEGFLSTPGNEKDWNAFYQYQSMDVTITARLYLDLYQELQDESPRLLELCDSLLIPGALSFSRVELVGFPLDVTYLIKLRESFVRRLQRELSFLRAVGRQYQIEEFNPNSHVQLKKILGLMKILVPNTEKETLQTELDKGHSHRTRQFLRLLGDYRQKSKVLSTYVDGLLSRVDSDGRVRPDFLLHGADTGRLACRDPNLQNIPILMGKLIRDAFIAPPGYKLINADHSQLELRVAAYMSNDRTMLSLFREKKDIHRRVAADIFEKPEDEISYYERYMAKYVDFGVIYGRGPKSLTEGFEAEYIIRNLGGHRWSMAEAQGIIDRLFRTFPDLKEWIDTQHQIVRHQKYVESPTGRRRRFPMISNDSVFSIERQAVNTPIQGFGSDINLYGVIKLDRILPEGAHVVSTVHDSTMLIVREDLVEQVLPVIRETMETAILDLVPDFNVPLKVDVQVGDRWGSLKD